MPLFRRADADLVKDESPIRTILPYLLKTRSESAIYHETDFDLTDTIGWLSRFNASDSRPTATLFHLLMYAAGRSLVEYPHLNRFVSGKRIYQRRDVHVTFAAKREMTPESPVTMIKVLLEPSDTFDDFVERVTASVREGRAHANHDGRDKLDVLLRFPGFAVGAAVALWRLADRWNLLPASWIEDDPMYTSICFTNLGSVGMSDTFHHLSEYGTASLFSSIGRKRKVVSVGAHGEPVVREVVQVRWSADERVADGFYAARSMQRVRSIVENPAVQYQMTTFRRTAPAHRSTMRWAPSE